MSSAHSPIFPSLHLRHNSFSNPSLALPTSQLILQAFNFFTYVTVQFSNPSFAYPTSQALHLIHLASPFSNFSVTPPTSQLILQPFPRFTYVTAHSPTLQFLHLRHSSILQPFFRLSYVTSSSLNSLGEPPMVDSEIECLF